MSLPHVLSLDCETNGRDLRWDPQAKTIGVSLADSPITGEYFPFQHEIGDNLGPSELAQVKQRIMNADLLLAHNMKFDKVALRNLGIDIGDKPYVCTMLMAHWVDENLPSKSLDFVSRRCGGSPKNKSKLMDKFIKDTGWGSIPVELMRFYAETDCELPIGIYEKYLPTWEAEGYAGDLWDRERKFTDLIIRMEALGVQIDQDLCQREMDFGNHRMAEIRKELKGLNPMSGPDLKKLLIDQMGIPSQGTTPGGKPSFDKNAMVLYEGILEQRNNPTAQLVLEYRGWQKTVSSNYGSYLSLLSDKGNVHPNFNLHRARTPRLSCDNPNLQQIPRSSANRWNGNLKKSFQPRSGYRLFEADYANLELRFAAVYSQEPNLLVPFIHGFKPFDIMAEQLGWERQNCKTFTYACVPINTTILTQRGWLTHNEVKPGDLTIGYNFETKRNEWTKITKVVLYDNAETVRLENDHWSFVSTPNHRWVNQRRHWKRDGRTVEGYKTTSDIATEDNLVLSATLDAASKNDISVEESSLIAWLVTDGHIRWSKLTGRTSQSFGDKRGVIALIVQHKQKGIDDIEDLLQCFKHSKYKHGNGFSYRIAPEVIRDIWNRARLHERSLSDLVLEFSSKQARVFYGACMLAEGYKNQFSQNDNDVLKAFHIVSYMCGYQPRLRLKEITSAGNDHYVIYSHGPTVTGQRLVKRKQPNQTVWCVQTELGTWTAKQNDQIVLTGNTLYGGGVGRIKDLFDLTQGQAKEMRNAWFGNYPGLQQASSKASRLAERRGYASVWTGRRRHLKYNESYKALNAILQGGAAELVKSVMLALDEVLDWDECRMLIQVHDSVWFEIAIGLEEKWLAIIREVMENVSIYHPKFGTIPFPVDIKEVAA